MKSPLALLLVIFTLDAYAQDPMIEWQNTIGGSGSDYLYSIQQTADGGYILGGISVSGISGDKTEASQGTWDYWVVKLDVAGNIIWQNTIGGSGDDRLTSVQQTADGGYILGGHSTSPISGDKTENFIPSGGADDYWIVKLDASGNIQWQNTIGGTGVDIFTSLDQTTDGGYILGGYSASDAGYDKTENSVLGTFGATFDYWVVKIDANGNIQWQNTIGGSHTEQLVSVQQTTDGGYILGGYSFSNISGDKTENSLGGYDYWIIKLDDLGNIQWQNTIGGDADDQLWSVQQTADGGYILGGCSRSNISGDKTENGLGSEDIWFVKTDALGNIQWQNTIGGNGGDYLKSIRQTNDGGYILGGFSGSNISGDKSENSLGGHDYWLVKTDALGNIQWDNTLGGSANEGGYGTLGLNPVQQTADSGYILGGWSISNISGDKTENNLGGSDYWVVKLKFCPSGIACDDGLFCTSDTENDMCNCVSTPVPVDDGIDCTIDACDEANDVITHTPDHSRCVDCDPITSDICNPASGCPSAQVITPSKLWDFRFGGSGTEDLRSIQQTTDEGYIVGGYSESDSSGDRTQPSRGGSDYWVVKIDGSGNKQWDKRFGGSDDDELWSLQQTSDGGYILGGYSYSGTSGDRTQFSRGIWDYWVVKIDVSGNKQWDKRFGGNGSDALTSIWQTNDGGYILGGYSWSDWAGDKTQSSRGGADYWVVKIDSSGNKQWDKRFGGDEDEFLHSLCLTNDGGYILGGYSSSDISGDKTQAAWGTPGIYFDYWIVKIDASGNKQWDKRFGGSFDDKLVSLQQTTDEGYILGGYSQSDISGDRTQATQGNYDYWIVKIDSSGNKLWDHRFGGSSIDYLLSLQQTTDGGYILGGYSYSGISGDRTQASQGNFDYWLVKINNSGSKQFDQRFGGNSIDYLYSIQQTCDNGYILGGYSASGMSGDKTQASQGGYDYWVVKLQTDSLTISGTVLTETGIPVPGVTVTLSGEDNQTTTTASDGLYRFTVVTGGDYTVTPSKANDVLTTNGINTLDVIRMQRHILSIDTFTSPYKIISAAEANAQGDTLVSTLDIIRTRQMILGMVTKFPGGRLWQFVSSDYIFPNPSHPFPFDKTRTYTNVTTNQLNQDFIGIKLGDVDDSWDAGVP